MAVNNCVERTRLRAAHARRSPPNYLTMSHTLSSEEFYRISNALFVACGATDEMARTTTSTLLEASLSGYDSHGIMRVPRYVNECSQGVIKAAAEPKIVRSEGGVVLLDGQFGLGPVAVCQALSLATERAQELGIACFATFNTNDVARLASYLEAPAVQGLFTLLMVNDAGGGPAVAPTGSTTPFLSTNPIAASIPTATGVPVLIDISTATTSVGKLRMAANAQQHVSEGILVKPEGKTETDPLTFFRSPRASAILPLGGMLMGHKGFALSLIVEALAGALGGSGCSSGKHQEFSRNGVFGLVIDPRYFVGRELYAQGISSLVAQLKSLEPFPENSEGVTIPGERSRRERIKRQEGGIPVDGLTWERLRTTCEQMKVRFGGEQTAGAEEAPRTVEEI